jgi:hypothetical protein
VKCYIWIIALCGAETWTLRKVYQKYTESFKMSCWKRIEKISCTHCVLHEILHRVKEDKCILHAIKRRKANWIGNTLRRNCFLKHVMEGKIKLWGRRGGRGK